MQPSYTVPCNGGSPVVAAVVEVEKLLPVGLVGHQFDAVPFGSPVAETAVVILDCLHLGVVTYSDEVRLLLVRLGGYSCSALLRGKGSMGVKAGRGCMPCMECSMGVACHAVPETMPGHHAGCGSVAWGCMQWQTLCQGTIQAEGVWHRGGCAPQDYARAPCKHWFRSNGVANEASSKRELGRSAHLIGHVGLLGTLPQLEIHEGDGPSLHHVLAAKAQCMQHHRAGWCCCFEK